LLKLQILTLMPILDTCK